MKRQSALQFALVFLLLAPWTSSAAPAAAQKDGLVLNGDGSTFAYPMYSKWIEEYEKDDPAVISLTCRTARAPASTTS